MPEVVVFLLRAVVLVLLWGFVVAAIVAVRHDVFGARPTKGAAQTAPMSPPTPRGSAKAKAKAETRRPAQASQLVVVDGSQRGVAVQLTNAPVTIGRAPDATLVLTDDYASNHHARLTPRGGDWVLEDVGSTNGTRLAGERVTGPVVVPVGRPIQIGRTTLELRA